MIAPLHIQLEAARALLPDLAECAPGVYKAACPGAACHSTRSGPTDFRIWIGPDRMPHCHCVHQSCAGELDIFMRSLYQEIFRLNLRAGGGSAPAAARRAPAPKPAYQKQARARYNPGLAESVAALCPFSPDDAWLLAHSPVPIPNRPEAWPALLLDNIFRPGDKILIFTSFRSQGQFLHTVPGYRATEDGGHERVAGGTVRLAPRPVYGRKPPVLPACEFPRGGRSGVWYLCAPVIGRWLPNPNARTATGCALGRRHSACCTRFPFLVLESDECPPEVWLRILVQLADPIVAVYTSGGKSYHALVRVDCATPEAFNLRRDEYALRLSEMGADVAAMSAVRLSRLPGCLRFGTGEDETYKPYEKPRMQKLLYLNPYASDTPIFNPAVQQSH